ncbi:MULTISPECIES: DUF6167 family protein [Mumia]|uniref:DUF6167 family protein n=1 Tax=Mumia xiangluensis TaxID=1678900 RepID=A0ABW1QNK6_9ACTN|nr:MULTISPECIES: DUF6167 family protein [Mumia]
MKGRVLWFVAGTTAGVYGTFRARRLAYRFTPTGLADQVAAWQVGARVFADEFRSGMADREAEIAAQLGLPTDTGPGPRTLDAAPRAPHALMRTPLPLSPYDE